MQRKTDEASVLQKRLHHLALESESGRDKAHAYASSLTPGGSKPRTPGGYKTPGKGQKPAGFLTTPTRQAGTPGGVTPRASMPGGKALQRQLADIQVAHTTDTAMIFCATGAAVVTIVAIGYSEAVSHLL